jgi:hypothetical protein
MFVNGSEQHKQSPQRTFHRCFLSNFGTFGQPVSEEKNFLNQPIRNKNCLWWPCLLMDRDGMSNLYRGPSIDASYQVSVHLAKRLQKRRIFKISQNQKQESPMAAMFVNGSGRNEQWGQHLKLKFQTVIILKNRPIRKKNCLWRPCLVMDRDKMSNLYRWPSIDASY